MLSATLNGYIMKLQLLKIIVVIFCFGSISIADEIETHLEKSNFNELTTYARMMHYLHELENSSPLIRMNIIGTSVEGRKIPALFFTTDIEFASKRKHKPVVFIICQQHGDEPSGKEAALIAARELIGAKKFLLDDIDLILVPMVNPDGSEKRQRKNAHDVDLNRNYVILSEPEAFAMHSLFLRWMPEVTLDIHEYKAIKKNWISEGFIKDADVMLDGVSNLNIDRSLFEFTYDTFIAETGRRVQEDDYRFHRYIVSTGNPIDDRIRHSTAGIIDARQSMGIYNTLSFIIEGKRYGSLTNKLEKRTRSQLSIFFAFLQTVSDHSQKIIDIVPAARQKLPGEETYLRMEYVPDPDHEVLSFPVFDLYQWKHRVRDFKNYAPKVKVKRTGRRPFAYVFGADQKDLIAVLKKHQIPMYRLNEECTVNTEQYTILHVTPGVEEDKFTEYIDLRINQKETLLAAGSVIVKTNNSAHNLIPLLLEPQSSWSLVSKRGGRKHRFENFIEEGRDYPILRIPDKINLSLNPLDTN